MRLLSGTVQRLSLIMLNAARIAPTSGAALDLRVLRMKLGGLTPTVRRTRSGAR